MGRKKDPELKWIRISNMFYAEKFSIKINDELTNRSDLLLLLGDKAASFTIWAGWERLNYLPDLDEEVKDFLNRQFSGRKRMYNTNVKEWKRLAAAVFIRDKYTCQYCGQVGGILECDHIVAFIAGGSDDITNLTTACQKCNRQKRDKTVVEFLDWLKNKSL